MKPNQFKHECRMARDFNDDIARVLSKVTKLYIASILAIKQFTLYFYFLSTFQEFFLQNSFVTL